MAETELAKFIFGIFLFIVGVLVGIFVNKYMADKHIDIPRTSTRRQTIQTQQLRA